MSGFEPIHGVQSRVVFLATLIAFVCMMSLATVPASFLVDDSAAGDYGGAAISDHADSGTTGKYMLATSRLGKFFYRLGDKLGLYDGKRDVQLFDPNTGTYVTKDVWKYDKSATVREWNAEHPYDACSADADCDDNNPATLDYCRESSGVTYCWYDSNCTQTTTYRDYDGDGYGDPLVAVTDCNVPIGFVSNADDCDDNNTELNPATVWYKDFDNDSYSDNSTLVQCTQPEGYKLEGALLSLDGDCDDNNAEINPNTTWYKDADDDGYSDGTTQGVQCEQPAGYKLASQLTATSGDCNDNDAAINPTTVWYKDTDNDGYSDGSTLTQCTQPADYKLASQLTATSGDCNDASVAVNPGATEVCNGIDDNCANGIDEGIGSTYYRDADNDTYGNPGVTTQSCSGAPSGYVSDSTDCNDGNAAVNPGAPEICDGLDNDCDGTNNEGLQNATAVGTPFQLAPSNHVITWPADIVYGGGKYLAVWNSNHEGTWNVYGSIVNLDESLGNVIDIATNADYNETGPVIAYHETANKWLVVYGDYRSASPEYYGMFLNNDGTPDGSTFLIRSPGDTYRPSVVAVPDGFFVVLPVSDNVYGKMVYLNGTVGSIVEISANASAVETFPYAVAAPGLGKVLVVWLDSRTEVFGKPIDGVEIVGRFVNATTGNPIDADFVVVPDNPSWPQKPSALEYNSKDNTFMIAWEDTRGTSWDIWAERLDANGNVIGSEFQLNDANAAEETDPDIAYNPVIDKYLAVWWANTSVMRAKILNSDGTVNGEQFDVTGTHQPFVAASRVTDEFIVTGADGTIIQGPCSLVQTTFFGQLTDSATGAPLAGKNISFYQDTGIDSQYGNVTNLENYMYSTWQNLTPKTTPDAVTDANGYFFANLADGTYNYVIRGSSEDEMEVKINQSQGAKKKDSELNENIPSGNFNAEGHILYSGKYEKQNESDDAGGNKYTCGQSVRFVMFGVNNDPSNETITFAVQDHTSVGGPTAPIIYNGSTSNASESLTVLAGNKSSKNFDWTIPCPRAEGKYDIHVVWNSEVWHKIGNFFVISDTTAPTINVGAGGSIFRGQTITIGYYAHDDPTSGTIPNQVVTMSVISGTPDTSINVSVDKGNGDSNVSVFGGNQEVNLTYDTGGIFTARFTACDPAGNCDYKERNITVWITEDDADAIALPLYQLFGIGAAGYQTDYYAWVNSSSPKVNATWDHYNSVWRIGDEYLTVGNNLTSEGGAGGNDAAAETGLNNVINGCTGPEYVKPIPPSTAAQYNQTLYNYLATLNATGSKPPNCAAI